MVPFIKHHFRKILRWLLGIAASLLALTALLLGPVDNSPITARDFYRNTMHRIDSFNPVTPLPRTGLHAAWAKVNITPKAHMPMAGYAPRDHFDTVHDSIFVRILGISNGAVESFMISADLLLFPPALKDKLVAANSGNRFLYFTATHAHSSLGGWDNSVIGKLILGGYHESWVDSLTEKIQSAIDATAANLRPATIEYGEANAGEYVENRLDSEHGEVDGIIRGLRVTRDDGSRGVLLSYSAHPTNISHLSRALSGDYPSSMVRQAERDNNFAMFASGTVGSHRVRGLSQTEFALCDTLARKLYQKIKAAVYTPVKDASISTAVIPIDFGPSQLHILQHFKIRDWVFNLLFRKLRGDIRYLKIGNIICLGMPCDFSGEIFTRAQLGKAAEAQGQKLFITSFNGDYVGYITSDDHYGHSEQEEVMAMNWVGPHFGDYFAEITRKIVARSR